VWSSPKARAWSGVVLGKVEDGGASVDSVEARWLGVGFTTLGASQSPSATLCRRSRGGGSVAGAVDDGVSVKHGGWRRGVVLLQSQESSKNESGGRMTW
jgi:hypothetical protein